MTQYLLFENKLNLKFSNSSNSTDKDNESISSYEDDESNDKRIIINKYYGNLTKSVFEIKDLIL
ncbi:hypothetical protein H8356DRAFT_1326248 [Neocallimastix lanati (nom. inval.)]|nr:hypothetical protein H8356DRAFT_1326248 [Neocallimastix sp. JGI-2020a]